MARAVIAGASGLVGSACLELLLESGVYDRVAALVRRPLAAQHKRLEQYAVDFDRPEEYARMVQGDAVFCCLGTTLKAAGSREAFRRVDFQYVLDLAKSASRNGVARFVLVSSAGASLSSPFFYPRVKAEAEAAVSALPFDAVHILRPSFLAGERRENRRGEKAALHALGWAAPLMIGPLRGFRPIHAATVARAMTRLAGSGLAGVRVHSSADIAKLGEGFGADDF